MEEEMVDSQRGIAVGFRAWAVALALLSGEAEVAVGGATGVGFCSRRLKVPSGIRPEHGG